MKYTSIKTIQDLELCCDNVVDTDSMYFLKSKMQQ